MNDLRKQFENYERYIIGPNNSTLASVIIPIIISDNKEYILFEKRSSKLRHQPGEISLPGGKIDLGESPIQAAIREACEELYCNETDIDIITEMDIYLSPSRSIIYSFLSYLNYDIKKNNFNKNEVDHLFLIPLDFFLKNKPDIYKNKICIKPDKNIPFNLISNGKDYRFGNDCYPVPFYKYKNYLIWGITARIIQNFIEKIKQK